MREVIQIGDTHKGLFFIPLFLTLTYPWVARRAASPREPRIACRCLALL